MSNEFLEILKTRRSVRAYKSDEVKESDLDAILEAGEFAPSGMGAQSPVIIAIRRKAMRDRIMKLNAKVMGTNSDPYYGAPVIVLVLADSTRGTWVEDGSLALGNMMNAAHALGLASCWIHREREIFDSEEGKKILKELNLSDKLRGVGSIALGYAKDGAINAPKPRKKDYIIKI